jgi:hypothetical protein
VEKCRKLTTSAIPRQICLSESSRFGISQPEGAQAARLRQRKHVLIEQFQIPDGLLPGTISCDSWELQQINCRCATGQRHESWSWTFMLDGKKRVEHVPTDIARLGVGRDFGGDALAYFTERLDPTPTRQAVAQTLTQDRRNKAFNPSAVP